MIFANDLNVLALKAAGTQTLVDEAVDFLVRQSMQPNSDKCEFLAFSKRPRETTFTVQGVSRSHVRPRTQHGTSASSSQAVGGGIHSWKWH
jgi:hypothetical protein